MRSFALAAVCSLAIPGLALSSLTLAQAYPTKPIRVIVPFTAGSLPDLVPRLVGEKAGPALGQPLVVENRVGAGGRIAADSVAKSAPDGYTLLLGTASTHVVSPFVIKSLPYDPFKDFTPIMNAVMPITGFVVNTSVPVNSVQEFIDYAKKNPGKLAYGSNGIGSSHHLRGEYFKIATGTDLLHIPYPGSNEVVTGIVNNTIQLSFSSPASIQQHVQAGKVKLLAMTMPKRIAGLDNVPTVDELVPGFVSTTDWFGFFGPGGLPRPMVTRLNAEFNKALADASIKSKFEQQSVATVGGTPEEFAATMKADYAVFGKVTKAINFKPE